MAYDNPGKDGGDGDKGPLFVACDILLACWLSLGKLNVFTPVRKIITVDGTEINRTDGMVVSREPGKPEA
ncbi:MAG: hypothetical protein JO253_01925 [Alphaproteobacteria bacterium]|nr:hypothetical protein [Alphaproteobacteria bacterium]